MGSFLYGSPRSGLSPFLSAPRGLLQTKSRPLPRPAATTARLAYTARGIHGYSDPSRWTPGHGDGRSCLMCSRMSPRVYRVCARGVCVALVLTPCAWRWGPDPGRVPAGPRGRPGPESAFQATVHFTKCQVLFQDKVTKKDHGGCGQIKTT